MNQNITILLATCNGENYLAEQLNSILAQTNKNWILLIHDDNSIDNTVDIIKHYQNKYPSIIQFLDDNIGFGNASKNFNYLLDKVDTEYIMFCDQDDVWLPNKIELTIDRMLEVEKLHFDIPILVHTDLKVVNREIEFLSESYWSYQGIDPEYNTLNRLLIQNVVTGSTVMINKKLACLASPIPKNVIMHDWWLGLVASLFGEIHHIERATILYRQHNNNDTGATSYNLWTIFNKAKRVSNINLKKYIDQTKELLDRYATQLNPEQTRLLNNFISIENASWIHSKQILLANNILKQNFMRSIGLLLCR